MGIHRLALATAASTFVLIVAGGLVTSTRSGLAVPDWPLSFGQVMPEMRGGVAYEHGHRMIAGTVALLIASLAVWLWRTERRRAVRRLGFVALAAVAAQALLGGMTVLLKLPPQISVAHASLAQGVLALTVCLAVVTSPAWKLPLARTEHPGARNVHRAALAAFAVVYLQLVAGAVLRHTGGALLLHVGGAVLATAALIRLAARILRSGGAVSEGRLARAATALLALLFLQVSLGISALAAGRPVAVTTAHVAVGALLLAATVYIGLWSWRHAGASAPAAVAGAALGAGART